jgi:hypothetical protein
MSPFSHKTTEISTARVVRYANALRRWRFVGALMAILHLGVVPVLCSALESIHEDSMVNIDFQEESSETDSGEGPVEIRQTEMIAQPVVFQRQRRTNSPQLLGKEHSPWGDFPEGTWIRTRLETETFRDDKSFRNVTETRITLQAFEDDHYRLKEEVAVEVGDQRFEDDPRFKEFDYYGQPLDDWDEISRGGETKLEICNRTVTCRLRIYVRQNASGLTRTKLWYTPDLAPFVLRVETTKTGKSEEENQPDPLLSKTITTTQDLGGFCGIGNRILANYSTRTLQKKGPNTVSTTSYYSSKIPGGLVHRKTVEKNAAGEVIRKSDLTLTEFQLPHWNQGYSDRYRLDQRAFPARRQRYFRTPVPLDASHSRSK